MKIELTIDRDEVDAVEQPAINVPDEVVNQKGKRMNINELSVETLKAMAYDEIFKEEQAKQNRAVLNQAIANKLKEAEDVQENTDPDGVKEEDKTPPAPAGCQRGSKGKTQAGKN